LFYSVEGIGKGHWGLRDFEPIPENFDYTEDDIGFSEGRAKLLQHILKERNPLVIRNAKEKFKEIHGKVYCEICGFDFFEKYGIIGENFIEGHHTIPLSELLENHKTKIDEIALVCSNCHKMLHRKRPWLTRDELSNLI
jgi:putative restriction endonuclease